MKNCNLLRISLLLFASFSVCFSALGGANPQPDLLIGENKAKLKGDDVYRKAKQKVVLKMDREGEAEFFVRIENDGDMADAFRLRGRKGSKRFRIKYHDVSNGGANITAALVRGKHVTETLTPGQGASIRAEVEAKKHGQGKGGKRKTFKIRSVSVAKPSARDQVRATVVTPKA